MPKVRRLRFVVMQPAQQPLGNGVLVPDPVPFRNLVSVDNVIPPGQGGLILMGSSIPFGVPGLPQTPRPYTSPGTGHTIPGVGILMEL